MQEEQSPRPITSQRHHDKIIELFSEMPRGSVLDVPAGEGALTVKLRQLGFEVETCDIDPAQYRAPGPPPQPGNLNDRLPFEDNRFDYVASVNGIHRVYGVDRAVSELARVLKPGGRLVLSFPNYGHIGRRLTFFFLGSVSHSVNCQYCLQSTDLPEANFRNMILIPQIGLSIQRHGLEILLWTTERRKRGILLLLPLAALAKLGAFFMKEARQETFLVKQSNAWGNLCGGPHLILIARKTAGNAPD